jgi:hypothetical protein
VRELERADGVFAGSVVLPAGFVQHTAHRHPPSSAPRPPTPQDLRACASSVPASTPLSEMPPALTRLSLDCMGWGGGPNASTLGRCGAGPDDDGRGDAGQSAAARASQPPAPPPPHARLRCLEFAGEAARPAAAAAADNAAGPGGWVRESSGLTALAAAGELCEAPTFSADLARLTGLRDLSVCFDFLRRGGLAARSASDAALDATAAGGGLRRLTALTLLAMTHDSPVFTSTPEFLGRLARLSTLPRLARLELGSCFGGQALMAGALGALAGLTSLELCVARGELVGDEHLTQLGKLPRLRRLAILGPVLQGPTVAGPRFSGSGLAPPAKWRALESLRVTNCFCFGVAGARALARPPPPPLRLLDLAGCTAVDDSCFCQLRQLSLLTGARASDAHVLVRVLGACVRVCGCALVCPVCMRA